MLFVILTVLKKWKNESYWCRVLSCSAVYYVNACGAFVWEYLFSWYFDVKVLCFLGLYKIRKVCHLNKSLISWAVQGNPIFWSLLFFNMKAFQQNFPVSLPLVKGADVLLYGGKFWSVTIQMKALSRVFPSFCLLIRNTSCFNFKICWSKSSSDRSWS